MSGMPWAWRLAFTHPSHPERRSCKGSWMKIGRYIVGAIGFVLVTFVVAIIVGFIMMLVFPPAGERVMVGIGLDWRNVPGTLLGIFAGIHSFRASIREPKQ